MAWGTKYPTKIMGRMAWGHELLDKNTGPHGVGNEILDENTWKKDARLSITASSVVSRTLGNGFGTWFWNGVLEQGFETWFLGKRRQDNT